VSESGLVVAAVAGIFFLLFLVTPGKLHAVVALLSLLAESLANSWLGAAVLGLYALGRVDSLAAVNAMVGATHRHTPIAGNVAVYQRLLPIFLSLPAKLEPEYRAIAAFQRECGGEG
jgi:gluconokinase